MEVFMILDTKNTSYKKIMRIIYSEINLETEEKGSFN